MIFECFGLFLYLLCYFCVILKVSRILIISNRFYLCFSDFPFLVWERFRQLLTTCPLCKRGKLPLCIHVRLFLLMGININEISKIVGVTITTRAIYLFLLHGKYILPLNSFPCYFNVCICIFPNTGMNLDQTH